MVFPWRSNTVLRGTGVSTTIWAWNSEHISDANDIVLYHLSDSAANAVVTDSSGNGYNGVAAVNTNTLSTTGKFGNGFDFADTHNFTVDSDIMDGQIINALKAQATFECWAKSNGSDWSAKGIQFFIHFATDGANYIKFFYTTADDTFYFSFEANDVVKFVNTSTGVDTTTWHHYSCTIDCAADEMKCYIDNVQQGSTQTPLGVYQGTLAIFAVGSTTAGADPADFIIDEVAVSDKVRY